jgi:hypothetical protein
MELKPIITQLVKKISPRATEPKILLQCSQEFASGLYPEPDTSNPNLLT